MSRPTVLGRPSAALAAFALLATGVVVSGAPDTASAAAPTAVSQAASTDTLSSRYSAFKTHAWDAAQPVAQGDTWTFSVPAVSSPPNRRRSEAWWSLDGRPVAYAEGDVITYQATVSADLGDAAFQRGHWHSLWQVIGTTDGRWIGPTASLQVADGQLRVVGGNGHPNHAPAAGRNYLWIRDLAPFQNGRAYDVKIQVNTSTDVEQGWVSAWVDGRKVLDRWRPVSRTGLRSGTFYPGSSEVYSRSGLYRGSDGVAAPTYAQTARVQKLIAN